MATRYRLRFLLQEFDLARGATLIGRSAECHVTIEDPLVSRQHAKIIISGDVAIFEDLGSRNGVKVNGTLLKGKASVRLKDGDRLRIGTQELVFCEVGAGAAPPAKTTGFLRYCAACRLPYPQELAACPACGATEQTDEDTLTGHFGASSNHAWSVQLLVEVTEKALALGRIPDAVRMLQRAKAQLEERLGSGGAVEVDQVESLAASALRVALAAEDPTWACWALHLYGELRFFPSISVIEALGAVGKKYRAVLVKPAEELLTQLRGRKPEGQNSGKAFDRRSVAELEQLVASLRSEEDTPAAAANASVAQGEAEAPKGRDGIS